MKYIVLIKGRAIEASRATQCSQAHAGGARARGVAALISELEHAMSRARRREVRTCAEAASCRNLRADMVGMGEMEG